eukprot:1251703-Amphidinium_carterae.1
MQLFPIPIALSAVEWLRFVPYSVGLMQAHRDANFHPKPEQLQSCVNAVFKDTLAKSSTCTPLPPA